MPGRKAELLAQIGSGTLETGIDWITFIAEERRGKEQVEEIAEEQRALDLANGSKERTFTFQGHKGWHTASVRVGYGPLGCILQSSGTVAGSIATRLASCIGRTTRLDVQATLTLSQPALGFARYATSLLPATRKCPTRNRPRIGHSSASDGLSIGTVGKRTKPRYLRVYDKGVEARLAPPGRMWRLELEAKGDLSTQLWDSFRSTPNAPTWCYESLSTQWKGSGCFWPLPPLHGPLVPLAARERGVAPAVSLMAWYRTSVAPTIPRSMKMYEVTEILDALGLGDVAVARGSDTHALRSPGGDEN